MSAKICPQCGREYAESEKFCTEDGATLRSTGGSEGLVNTVVADRYHVTKKLGEGGMGQVYLAEHVRMKRKCALKVMHPAMGQDPDAVSRFNREAANAAQIIHPNVAAVFDFGETPDRLIYLAMEYIEGESLSAVVEKAGALPARRAASIAAQAAEGLGAAHDLGIVHRDLKPDNIMIARARDGRDQVKVVDFGIAKAMGGGSDGQKVTRTGFVIGTPEYMSPEQLVGDPVDGRSDIYSLALVAFNMFTGTLPFPSRTSQEAMIMRLTQQPKTLAEMRGDVPWPPELQAVMDRALARDPNERYASAREFGRDLTALTEKLPNLTAEQLGTQMQAAVRAAQLAGASAARAAAATPTMAVAPGAMDFSATTVGAPPSAARGGGVPRGAGGTQRMSAGGSAAPAPKGGMGTKIAIGAGVGLVAIAGAMFALKGGSSSDANATSSTPALAAATPAASVDGGASTATTTGPAAAPADPAAGGTSPTVGGAPAADAPSTASVPVDRRAATTSQPATRPASTPVPQAPTRVASSTATSAPPVRATTNPQQGTPPSYSAPAVSPPATQPTSNPVPAAPAFDKAAAAAEVQGVIRQYVAAFESRKVDELRRYFPSMPADMIRDWSGLLGEKSVSELRSRVTSVAAPDFDDETHADTRFTMTLDFKLGGSKQPTQTITYGARLRKDGSNWRIQSLSGN